MPLAAIYPFASLRAAYAELARRKAWGEIVLALDATLASRSGRPHRRQQIC